MTPTDISWRCSARACHLDFRNSPWHLLFCTMSADASLDKKNGAAQVEVSAMPLPAENVELVHVTRRRGLLGFYDGAMVQVCILGFVCFLGPGMFNALSGMGGGGLSDPNAAVKASIALYSVFAGVSFFSGSIHNMIGSRAMLFIGESIKLCYSSRVLTCSHRSVGLLPLHRLVSELQHQRQHQLCHCCRCYSWSGRIFSLDRPRRTYAVLPNRG